VWRRAGAGGLLAALLVLLLAPAGASLAMQQSAPSRGAGIDGGLPDTTNGEDDAPATVDTAPTTTPAATDRPATTDTTATTTPAAPAVTSAVTSPPATTTSTSVTVAGSPAVAAPATTSVAPQQGAADPGVVGTVPIPPNEVAGAGDAAGDGALRTAAGGESGGAVQSPGLLLAGLGMVVAGAVALLVRSRRAPGGHYS
jgi:hypothetical protein